MCSRYRVSSKESSSDPFRELRTAAQETDSNRVTKNESEYEGNVHERKREACQILSGNTSLVHTLNPRDFELYAENDIKSVHFIKIVLNNTMEGGQCEAKRIARRQMCGLIRGMKD